MSGSSVAVCIPTRNRANSVQLLLHNLHEQTKPPDTIVVVDSSDGAETKDVCDRAGWASVLRYVHSAPGLPLQRLRAVQEVDTAPCDFICFLDDDVLLDPPFLATLCRSLDTTLTYDGVAGFDREHWGKPAFRLDMLWKRLGAFDGEFHPGRWFRCGHFFELDHASPSGGIQPCDWLPGFQAVWRRHVFEEFRPPVDLPGYALGEDKHFGLRVGTKHRMAIVPDATLRHLHVSGGRPKRLRLAFARVRANARFVRECDPHPTWRRYATFVAFHLADGVLNIGGQIIGGRWSNLPAAFVGLFGAMSCVVPPRLTADALVRRG